MMSRDGVQMMSRDGVRMMSYYKTTTRKIFFVVVAFVPTSFKAPFLKGGLVGGREERG